MACSSWARIMESARRMLRPGIFLFLLVKGRRTRSVPLLVPDELADLVGGVAQQDAGEFEQDDFDHGHGGCGLVMASMRICSNAWTMASAPFLYTTTASSFPL